MSSNGDQNSPPSLPPDSPGSSVSAYLQEEYDELMKYAVVVPTYDPSQPFENRPGDLRSFPQGIDSHGGSQQRFVAGMSAETGGSNTTPRDSNTTPHGAREIRNIVPGQAAREEEAIVTVTSKAPSGGVLTGDSSDNDTLTGDTGNRSGRADIHQPGYGQSAVMRDIFPDMSDDDVRSGQSQARSGQEDSSREQSGRLQTTEKKDVSEQRFFHPSFLSGVSDSMSEASEGEVRRVIMSTTIDPDTTRMENLLDQWSLDLKRNVLAEYGQSKIRIIELGKIELQKAKEKHAAEMNDCRNEVETLKELLHTYEKSVDRKDQVISNLTRALQKNKEKVDMMKKFNEWKLRHNDSKREAFGSNLARSHYERKLAMKVWAGWHSVIETKWRTRVEKACQAKAQEVCVGLTNDYEARISALTEALESARLEVSRLHKERERYEEMMKKAFMRGVCALNLEAMSIFQGGEEAGAGGAEAVQSTEEFSSNFESNIPQKDYAGPKTIPQEAVYREEPPPSRVQPRVVGAASHVTTSHTTGVRTSAQIPSRQPSARPAGKTKTVSTRITSKVNTGLSRGPDLPTLAPPMSTVMVERHQPVVKQTVGHATASKYPVKKDTVTVISGVARTATSHRKIAGQTGGITPHVQSVKVVE